MYACVYVQTIPHSTCHLHIPATNSWARFLPRTCQELAKNLPRSGQDLAHGMPRLCRPSSRHDLAKNLPKILSKMIPRYDDKIMAKGPFINYVTQIKAVLDPPPPPLHHGTVTIILSPPPPPLNYVTFAPPPLPPS